MAVRYYSELFRADPEAGGDFVKGRFPYLDEDAGTSLVTEYT